MSFSILTVLSPNKLAEYYLYVISITIYGCCDFISQSILIYRCWVVWGCNIYVVIIPLILTFAFLPIWLSHIGSVYMIAHHETFELKIADWGWIVLPTGLSMSLIVNAFVTALIAFRIVKIYCEIKPTLHDRALGGRKLRSVICVIIESGMALFAFQMVMVVCHFAPTDSSAIDDAVNLVIGTHQMLVGITPTIIQLRVLMALSDHDENSTAEAASLSLFFASGDPDPIPKMPRSIVHLESREDGIGFR